MKATGVVRRIDELGRIVIPKELRKTLRINEGENIEIFMDDSENIVLKKFSSLKKITDLAFYMVSSINQMTKLNCFIMDTDSIVAYAGSNKKDYQDKKISDFLLNIMEKKKNCSSEEREKVCFVDKTEDIYYHISLIKQNGDILGGIVIFSSDNISDSSRQMLDIFSLFLEKYLE